MRTARRILLLTLTIACLTILDHSEAKKPVNTGGGKGGGSGSGYSLVRLPDEDGVTDLNGYAAAMHELRNSSDEVVGLEVVGYLDYQAHYWMVNAAGVVTTSSPLPLPAGADPASTFTNANDINEAGNVVGFGGLWPANSPLYWATPIDDPVDLPIPDFADRGVATNINNNGLIIGLFQSGDIDFVAAWGIKQNGDVVGPEVLASGSAEAPDVNDAGEVVATLDYQAYKWGVDWDGETLNVSNSVALTAEILDDQGNPQTVPLLRAAAINEHGDICGLYRPDGGWLQCYLLTAEGNLLDVANLVDNRRYGTSELSVFDLNDAADVQSIQVVGQAYIYQKDPGVVVEPETPVLWQGNQATDLQKVTDQPDPQLWLKHLVDVSDGGYLAGFGWTADADPRAVVLIPK